MKVKFDETEFHLTKTTISSLRIFMILYLKNLRDSGKFDNECWTWGLATVNDFCKPNAVDFTWGGDEDIPNEYFKQNEVYAHI